MIAELHSPSDIEAARNFIRGQGLSFEAGCDELVGAYENGRLVGTGARAGNVLKMLAVEPACQGGSILGDIATVLLQRGYAAGHDTLFVFTKPEHAVTFERLNFSLVAIQGRAALLEHGRGMQRWLEIWGDLVRPGRNGAVVINGNPFTLGHRHLVEIAARRLDHLYLFVVREDRSVFPYGARRQMAAQAVAELSNVFVLDTGPYAVSAATFPTYFLKSNEPAARIQVELDAAVFASRMAPFFEIVARFVGTEPHCPLTASYNQALRRVLPDYGVSLIEIERRHAGGAPISASRVRDLLAEHGPEAVASLVPESTLAYLRSPEGACVLERLRTPSASRHENHPSKPSRHVSVERSHGIRGTCARPAD